MTKGFDMKRKISLAAGVLSLAVMGLTGFSPAAQAATEPPAESVSEFDIRTNDADPGVAAGCASNRFCLYENDQYTGPYYVQEALPAGVCYNLVGRYDNWASSMKNNLSRQVKLYDRLNCAGAVGYTARADSEDNDLTNNGFDNKTSSMKS
jgi:hypothetical protein